MRNTLLTILATTTLLTAVSIPTETTSYTAEQNCLALNIYFEARGTPRDEQRAVGSVTLNRAAHPAFPNTVCGVVYQPSQFSWVRDQHSNSPRDQRAFATAQDLAGDLLRQHVADNTDGATYFYDHRRVNPPWRRGMTVTLRTSNHTYLRNGRRITRGAPIEAAPPTDPVPTDPVPYLDLQPGTDGLETKPV